MFFNENMQDLKSKKVFIYKGLLGVTINRNQPVDICFIFIHRYHFLIFFTIFLSSNGNISLTCPSYKLLANSIDTSNDDCKSS